MAKNNFRKKANYHKKIRHNSIICKKCRHKANIGVDIITTLQKSAFVGIIPTYQLDIITLPRMYATVVPRWCHMYFWANRGAKF